VFATVTTSAGKTSYVYDADGSLLLQKDPGQSTLYLFGDAQEITGTGGSLAGTRFIALPGGGQVVRTGAGGSSPPTAGPVAPRRRPGLMPTGSSASPPAPAPG
jgi:hypothetical protein